MKKSFLKSILFTALSALFCQELSAQDLQFVADPLYTSDLYVNNPRIPILISLENTSPRAFISPVDVWYEIIGDSAPEALVASRIPFSLNPGETYTETFYIELDSNALTGKQLELEVWTTITDSVAEVSDRYQQTFEVRIDGAIKPQAALFEFDLPELARFGEQLALQFKLGIDGTDYNDERALELYTEVNGVSASRQIIYSRNTPLRGLRQDTVFIDTVLKVDALHFSKGGGNVVVVWPIGFLRKPIDSFISDTLEIGWPMFIDGDVQLGLLDVYPSISTGAITLSSKNYKIERVRIFSTKGEQIQVPHTGQSIQLNDIAPGAYTLVVQMSNGTTVRRKVVFIEP